ncbi:MarR family winged helix-turn-helix transcriptional regulator [Microlunatus sp. Gsoil 973]|uniref:MarR family winged helix-turn-helix transcriptional regulator n=1 Tax=Microlunatus sp. Gsoil 973 TaxID=2672569 RepID=UPI0012B4E916|nr:MarR family transcriptional regulator [Microlunatus sp. Gsoil 973]QGN32292.1 MarR family transcriptional regulator [Microlunatus sp. Gsoil 973]
MPDRQTAQQINSGAIHILRALRVVDRRAGLTAARLSALSVLVFGGPHSLGGLAAAEDVTSPTMTRIVDGLEREGLARRRALSGPGRPVEVSATARGRRLMERAARRRLDALETAIDRLPAADQRRLRAAAPVLEQLAGHLRSE